MKIAYFDCYSGISGDMTLGALLANGLSLDQLNSELAKLNLSGYKIESKPVMKKGISAFKVDVIMTEKQQFRHLPQIIDLIQSSTLADPVKEKSIQIFQRLGAAEAKIHGIPLEKVHFHEVGALDAIIDIVGSIAGLYVLGIDKIYASKLNLGSGTVKSEHGIIPVPAPATVELCKNIPVYSSPIELELVTPTGAALITTLAVQFGDIPSMRILSSGYGAGTADLTHQANVMRIIIGEPVDSMESDIITVIETNIDDLNPQIFDYLSEQLFASGALDVYLLPVQMKKNRPGVILTVLCRPEDKNKFMDIIFSESTTFGIRSYQTQRTILKRELKTVKTQYGEIRVKLGYLKNKLVSVTPEYEDCKKIAKDKNIPLKEIISEVIKFYWDNKYPE